MSGLHLIAKVQQQLEHTLHHTHDARLFRRTLAILEYSRGRPIKEVAQSLGVTRQSIHNLGGQVTAARQLAGTS